MALMSEALEPETETRRMRVIDLHVGNRIVDGSGMHVIIDLHLDRRMVRFRTDTGRDEWFDWTDAKRTFFDVLV